MTLLQHIGRCSAAQVQRVMLGCNVVHGAAPAVAKPDAHAVAQPDAVPNPGPNRSSDNAAADKCSVPRAVAAGACCEARWSLVYAVSTHRAA